MPLPRIALAQINPTVGAIEHNATLITAYCQRATEQDIDVIAFPELALTGYPPEDLLYRDALFARCQQAIEELRKQNYPFTLIIGLPIVQNGKIYNAAAILQPQKTIRYYLKQHLPNYDVFDEKRYFSSGSNTGLININGHKIGLVICEDLWCDGPAEAAKATGAEYLISINASPFHRKQASNRTALLQEKSTQLNIGIAYVNLVGAQDELIFDGDSQFISPTGQVEKCAENFKSELCIHKPGSPSTLSPAPSELSNIYQALVLGLKDYLQKNHFSRVVLGLSGGIDSALTLKIAYDAIGPKNIHCFLMPSRYTADMSNEDAITMCNHLGVSYDIVPIHHIFESFQQGLSPVFQDLPADLTEENLQARIRGTLLMAYSNKKGALVLATGNKSELAVGFSTLYGDMCGGFAPIKDVPKTLVYALSRYCNEHAEVIPWRIIERPPSAELAPDQVDQDRLPPYEILDRIIEYFVEQDLSAEQIIANGFDHDTVKKVIGLIKRNEYKRSQAPIGSRITARAFGKDRRYPITHGLF